MGLAATISTPINGRQRKLVLDDSPTLALATVETARHQLPGHDEDDILALIEEGFLLYAWNIGLGQSREVRILPACITHYQQTLGSRAYPRTDDQVAADLIAALRATGKQFVAGTSLRILLNCSSTHVINLLEARGLKIQPGTTWCPGPNGSPLITITSFITFMQSRRIL